MNRTVRGLLLLPTLGLFSACVSTRQDAPAWYLAPPAPELGLSAAGSGKGPTKAAARAAADSAGCRELARVVSERLELLTRRWAGEHQGETPSAERVALVDAARAVATLQPVGCVTERREERRFEDGSWMSFALRTLGPTGALAAFQEARALQPALKRSPLSWESLDRELANQLQPQPR